MPKGSEITWCPSIELSHVNRVVQDDSGRPPTRPDKIPEWNGSPLSAKILFYLDFPNSIPGAKRAPVRYVFDFG